MAEAYLSAAALPGSNAAVGAMAIGQADAPTVPATTRSTITVSWPVTTMPDGRPVTGYRVTRYDAGTQVAQATLAGCAGVLAGTSCTESNVPDGLWRYTVTPLVGANWVGIESPLSTPVRSDSTVPGIAVSLNVLSGSAVKSGNTVYYRGAAAGAFTLTDSVTDAGSGPASSSTASLTGTSTGWSHSASSVSTPAGGPFTSATFSWTAGTSSSPVEVVTGRDVAGNSTTASLTFVNDSAGPSGGAATITGLSGTGSTYSTSTTLHLALSAGTDVNGVASGATLQRAYAPLTSTGVADGVCGTFGGFSALATDPASSYDDVVTGAGCYKYQYVVSDALGNTTVYLSNAAKVDPTAPSPPLGSFSNFVNTYAPINSATFYYNPSKSTGSITATPSATDPESGVTGYGFPDFGSGWTMTPGANGAVTYSWSGTPAAPGAKYVTATNNAGLTSAGQAIYPTPDSTAPSTGTISYSNAQQSSTAIPVTFTTGTDAGSGIGTRVLQRAAASWNGTTCGTFAAFATIVTNPTSPYTDSGARGQCYKYQYVVSDNVGNQGGAATSASIVKIAPTYYSMITGTTGLTNYWRLGELSGASMVDSKGGVTGSYVNAPTLGAAGAFGDGNASATFDGVSDYASVNKTLAASFTVEFSFRSTTGLGDSTATQWWQGAGLVDADVSGSSLDWGISLRGDGAIMAGDGNGSSDLTAISTVGGFNDGQWHLVDVTRNQATGLISIYVDGTAVGSKTGTTSLLTSPTVTFGRIHSNGNSLAGGLDDVSFYSSALSSTTISNHYVAAGY